MKNNLFTRLFFGLMFVSVLVFLSCNDATNPALTDNQLTGTISDEQDVPVPNAVVQAYTSTGKSATSRVQSAEEIIAADTTDEDGNYQLNNLPEDLTLVEVRITHADFKEFHDRVTNMVKNKVNGKHHAMMQHNEDCCGIITFTVKDSTSGVYMKNVEVRLNRGKEIIRKAYTDSLGYLRFENVCLGSYWVRIAKEGYKVIEKEFNVLTCDSAYQFTYQLAKIQELNDSCCHGVIKVLARDSANGDILTGAKVVLWSGGKVLATKYVEHDFVVFTNICEGLYGVDIVKEGYDAIEFNVEMGCNDTVEFNKAILKNECCFGVVNLSVLDEKLQGLKEVKVKLWKGGTLLRTVYTDADGFVSLRELCNGAYQISLTKDGYTGQEFNFELGCNDTVNYQKFLVKPEADTCCKGVIKVYPKDSESGEALNGAEVTLWKDGKVQKSKLSENGFAMFSELCTGNYVVSIGKTGYNSIEFKIELGCNKTVEIEKSLTPKDSCCKGIIKIHPQDAESGAALNGATVKLWLNGTLLKTATVVNGVAGFDGLCEGKYGVDIIATGYKSIEFAVELGCNKTVELEKALTKIDTCCKGIIKIYPQDSETGEAINGATVKLWKGGAIYRTATVTNRKAVFDGLCDETYGVSITASGYKTIEFNVELGCNKTVELEKAMTKVDSCCKGIIKIYPQDSETGEAINGAIVRLWKNGTLYRTATVTNGKAAFDGLCEGKYGVDVTASGYKAVEFTIELGCNKTVELEKAMVKTDSCCKGIIKVFPKDSTSGEALTGSIVKIYKGGTLLETITVAEGKAVFDGLCEGKYSFAVLKEGYYGIEFSAELGCNKTLELVKKLLKK